MAEPWEWETECVRRIRMGETGLYRQLLEPHLEAGTRFAYGMLHCRIAPQRRTPFRRPGFGRGSASATSVQDARSDPGSLSAARCASSSRTLHLDHMIGPHAHQVGVEGRMVATTRRACATPRGMSPTARFATLEDGDRLQERRGRVWNVVGQPFRHDGLVRVVVRSGDLVRLSSRSTSRTTTCCCPTPFRTPAYAVRRVQPPEIGRPAAWITPFSLLRSEVAHVLAAVPGAEREAEEPLTAGHGLRPIVSGMMTTPCGPPRANGPSPPSARSTPSTAAYRAGASGSRRRHRGHARRRSSAAGGGASCSPRRSASGRRTSTSHGTPSSTIATGDAGGAPRCSR